MTVARRQRTREFERMCQEMEDVFHSMLITTRNAHRRTADGSVVSWRPALDVYETDDALVVVAEMAGVVEDEITISLLNNTLTISGTRTPRRDDSRQRIHEMGILYGRFAADLYLPFAVESDSVQASYRQGLLQIRLNRVKPTKIPVTGEAHR